jgi:hypothetical protein
LEYDSGTFSSAISMMDRFTNRLRRFSKFGDSLGNPALFDFPGSHNGDFHAGILTVILTTLQVEGIRMNPDRKAAETFLVKNRMHPDAIDLSKTVEHMLVEMARGLNGEASSLAMIPTYVEVDAQNSLGSEGGGAGRRWYESSGRSYVLLF